MEKCPKWEKNDGWNPSPPIEAPPINGEYQTLITMKLLLTWNLLLLNIYECFDHGFGF
jgi:hypothetical protein